MGNFDSVFDTSTNLEQKWDTVFDSEEDSTLMDMVAGMSPEGYNEGCDIGGESDPGPGNDSKNKPTDDSSDQDVIDKDPAKKIPDGGESEADKWHNDEDEEYQDGKSYGSKDPDPENILGWQTRDIGLKEGGDEDCDDECDDEDLVSGIDDDDSEEDDDDDEDDDDLDDEDLDEVAGLSSESEEDKLIDTVENQPEPDKNRLKKDLALSDDDDELIDTVLGEN